MLSLLAAALLASASLASPSPVTTEDCEAAERDEERLWNLVYEGSPSAKTWDDVYAHYRRFGTLYFACSLGETQSAVVQVLLEKRWDLAPSLLRRASDDRAFFEWVLEFLSVFGTDETYAAIRKSAQSRCPAGRRALCERIAAAAARGHEENRLEREAHPETKIPPPAR